MEDMRRLIETVQPLFEGYTAGAEESANGGFRARLTNPEGKTSYLGNFAYKDKKTAKYEAQAYYNAYFGTPGMKTNDTGAERAVANYRKANAEQEFGEQVTMQSEDVVTEESNVEAIEELENILDDLERLGEQAKQLVRSISPDAERQLSAYGAFDFGGSSNQYDVTLAGFIDDAQSGSYDDE